MSIEEVYSAALGEYAPNLEECRMSPSFTSTFFGEMIIKRLLYCLET